MILTRTIKGNVSVLVNTTQGKSGNVTDHNSIELNIPGERSQPFKDEAQTALFKAPVRTAQ